MDIGSRDGSRGETRALRILFISSVGCWGGGEVWLMDVMRELKTRGHEVTLVCRRNTPLSRAAAHQGYDVVQMRIGGDLDPAVLWKLWRVMKKRAVDVVCTSTDKDLRLGGIAGKVAGVSAVISSREVDYPLKRTPAYRFSYTRLASTVVANSRATKNTILRSAPYLNDAKITVVFKGIN